ncbi:MAG: hypothetical protein AAFV95_02390 [Bacteroidota bacterium]
MQLLLLIGCSLRLLHHLTNRSLWYDEAMLAINFIQRDFLGLLSPLEYQQQAPLLYMWSERALVELLGHLEYVLRFPSLLAGLLSLWLFRSCLRHFLSPPFQLWAMAFFVFSQPLVFYAAELKQYSFDLAVALLLLHWSLQIRSGKRALWALGLGGIIGLLCSMPAIFGLASCGTYLLVVYLRKKELGHLWRLLFWGAIWLLVFGANYWVLLRPETAQAHVMEYHRPYFMPLSFWEWSSWKWYAKSYFGSFRDLGGILFKHPAGLLALLGMAVGWRRKKGLLFLLLCPMLLAYGASAVEKYSTLSRLMLFTTPAWLILLGLGMQYLDEVVQQRWTSPWSAWPVRLLGIVLMIQPVLNSVHRLVDGHEISAFRKTMAFVETHKKPGDVFYIHPGARPQFRYYRLQFPLEDLSIQHSTLVRKDWQAAFQKHKGRGWVIFGQFGEYELEYSRYLERIGGQKLLECRVRGSVCYLYEWNNE